jgi:hypothetical protein
VVLAVEVAVGCAGGVLGKSSKEGFLPRHPAAGWGRCRAERRAKLRALKLQPMNRDSFYLLEPSNWPVAIPGFPG